MAPKPSHYADIVRAHKAQTFGYIVASAGSCLDLRDTEIARIKRTLRPLAPEDLSDLAPAKSWLLAVLLCPGDATRSLAQWASRRAPSEIRRIKLYAHPDVDLVGALADWYDAGIEAPYVREVHDFASFHRAFGNDLNDQIYEDATRRDP